MTEIEKNLKKILESRYGKDVRQSIHDSISEMNAIAVTSQDSARNSAGAAKTYKDSCSEYAISASNYAAQAKQYAEEAFKGAPEGYQQLYDNFYKTGLTVRNGMLCQTFKV